MSQMKKHFGKIVNTDQRCVVVLMEIPGADGQALVLPTDNLPPRYEQVVRELAEGEGQNTAILADLLSRRRMPDNGLTVLQTLHEGNWMMRVPQSNVVMLPRPNQPFPLDGLVASMKAQGVFPRLASTPPEPRSNPMTSAAAAMAGVPVPPPAPKRMELVQEGADPSLLSAMGQQAVPGGATKFNPHTVNMMVGKAEDAEGIARNLLLEAQMIEGDAAALLRDAQTKRERAYNMAPAFRPPPVSEPESVSSPVAVAEQQGAKAAVALAAGRPKATTRRRNIGSGGAPTAKAAR